VTSKIAKALTKQAKDLFIFRSRHWSKRERATIYHAYRLRGGDRRRYPQLLLPTALHQESVSSTSGSTYGSLVGAAAGISVSINSGGRLRVLDFT